MLADRWTICAE